MAAAITIDAIDIVLLDFDIVFLLLRRPAIELISNNCTAASQSPAKQYRFLRKTFLYFNQLSEMHKVS